MTRTNTGLHDYIRSLDSSHLTMGDKEFIEFLDSFKPDKPQFPTTILVLQEEGWVMVYFDKDGNMSKEPPGE